MTMTKKGRFITFEGGEGCGKSTQSVQLAGFLRAAGIDVHETREPGGTPQGEALRSLLVHGDPDRWSPFSEILLVTAARIEHVERVVDPALREGTWVVCDRFVDSTIAYQAIAGGADPAFVWELQTRALGEDRVFPDLTFLLDVRPESGLRRAEKRGGTRRFENKGEAFHRTIRKGFLALAEEHPDRIVVIDAEERFDEVRLRIEDEVRRRFDP